MRLSDINFQLNIEDDPVFCARNICRHGILYKLELYIFTCVLYHHFSRYYFTIIRLQRHYYLALTNTLIQDHDFFFFIFFLLFFSLHKSPFRINLLMFVFLMPSAFSVFLVDAARSSIRRYFWRLCAWSIFFLDFLELYSRATDGRAVAETGSGPF